MDFFPFFRYRSRASPVPNTLTTTPFPAPRRTSYGGCFMRLEVLSMEKKNKLNKKLLLGAAAVLILAAVLVLLLLPGNIAGELKVEAGR